MSIIDQFLLEIAQIVRAKDGPKLQDYLVLEPPLPLLYNNIVSELRQNFPFEKQDVLESKCEKILSFDDEEAGGPWTAFISFLVQYFAFLRDVNVEQLLETHDMLKSLLNHSILALGDTTKGLVILPTVITLSRTLARLAIGLDKRPELIEHLQRRLSIAAGDEAEERVTLVEGSANVIREAFKKCLSERGGNAAGLDANGRPEGKRVGIYLCANICLKLFFHCRKLRSGEQIFGNIYQQSPPLAKFPASQRVTYLYYLGRYLFANNHFFRAQRALQAAYDQCHTKAFKQRRTIIVYLMASNIILGRFPSTKLLQRPEAESLAERFLPICRAIKQGDLRTFESLLGWEGEYTTWLLRKRILLQLRTFCTITVWRSLARRTFLLSGFQGDTSKKAPSLDLRDLLTLGLLLDPPSQENGAQFNGNSPTHDYSNGASGEDDVIEEDPGSDDEDELCGLPGLSMFQIESLVASMVQQELLHGYISHKYLKFVITGAKGKNAVEIGFPDVWNVVQSRSDSEVPGWVMAEKTTRAQGMVVKLNGARPAGAGPVD